MMKALIIFSFFGASFAMAQYGRATYAATDPSYPAGYAARRKVDYYKVIGDENRDGIPDKFDKNRNGIHDNKEGYHPKPGYSETLHGYKGSTNYKVNQGGSGGNRAAGYGISSGTGGGYGQSNLGGHRASRGGGYDKPTSYPSPRPGYSAGGSQGYDGNQGGNQGYNSNQGGNQGYSDNKVYAKNSQAGYGRSRYGRRTDENRDGIPDNEDLNRNGKRDNLEPYQKPGTYVKPSSGYNTYANQNVRKTQPGYGGSDYDNKPQIKSYGRQQGYKPTYGASDRGYGQEQGYGKQQPRSYYERKPDGYGENKYGYGPSSSGDGKGAIKASKTRGYGYEKGYYYENKKLSKGLANKKGYPRDH